MTKVCISSCVGTLDRSTTPLEDFSRLLSLSRRAETSMCTHTCMGFPSVSCGSCDTDRDHIPVHCIGHSYRSDRPWPLQPFSQACVSVLLCTNTSTVAFPLEAESPRAEHPADEAKELPSLAPSLQQMDKPSPDQQHGPGM